MLLIICFRAKIKAAKFPLKNLNEMKQKIYTLSIFHINITIKTKKLFTQEPNLSGSLFFQLLLFILQILF
jgi:hypothetical protein